MTSWDSFLVDFAEHLAFSTEKLLTDKYTNALKISHGVILQELRSRLLPLLEAADQVCGEAMDLDGTGGFSQSVSTSAIRKLCAAKEAALKETK